VATASFLASRAAPSAGFWVGLAGGVALARSGQQRGLRTGYGAAIAAMLQTVAIMGPARFGVPLTQALSAPLLGRLEARGASVARQISACAAIRLAHTTATAALFVLVLAGGLQEYRDFYDSLAGKLPLLPQGQGAALAFMGIGLLAWAAFASTVQVLVYLRGLRRWPREEPATLAQAAPDTQDEAIRAYDPRTVALSAAVAFCLLLASTAAPLLAAAAAWLALAWAFVRGDRDVLPAGIAIAVTLAAGVLVFALFGGAGIGLALRRASRAGLLVLVATWLRSAAGASGLREVSRRALGRLRRLPAVPEASRVLDELGSGRQLGGAARSIVDAARGVPRRPLPLLDTVLAWVAAESVRFRPSPAALPLPLRVRARDVALVVSALAPALALLGARG